MKHRLPHHVPAANGTPRKAVVIGAGPAGLEAARVLGLRGHRVVVLEASDAAGGQIRLASSSPRRRDLIGIIDWRLAECKHFDVDIRYNTYAEADEVLAEDPDLVVDRDRWRPEHRIPAPKERNSSPTAGTC